MAGGTGSEGEPIAGTSAKPPMSERQNPTEIPTHHGRRFAITFLSMVGGAVVGSATMLEVSLRLSGQPDIWTNSPLSQDPRVGVVLQMAIFLGAMGGGIIGMTTPDVIRGSNQ